MSSPDFDAAIAELNSKVGQIEMDIKKKDSALSPLIVSAICVPLLIAFLLYALKFNIITSIDEETGEERRDVKKVFLWTLGLSVLFLSCLYLYASANHLLS